MFDKPGATVLVDGQFGSTGKGLFAGYLAEKHGHKISHVTTNAGPNSGHTAFYAGEKIVSTQVPIAGIILVKRGYKPFITLNAGAMIDLDRVMVELEEYGIEPYHIRIHPCAALISDRAKAADGLTVSAISSTGKGTGPALANKILRRDGSRVGQLKDMGFASSPKRDTWSDVWDWSKDTVFVETAQGFSLGVNEARFAPYTTSRECTVMQAIADARIPAQMVNSVIMTLRTFPIRVGNAPNSYSGDCYPDQIEMDWDELGIEPELTTVTKRPRRIFTWSAIQFREAVAANRPDILFLNFCNYMNDKELKVLIQNVFKDYKKVMGKDAKPRLFLGYGPKAEDIIEWLG